MVQFASQSHGRVAILMATFNGARFLHDQMASLHAQDWPSIDLYVSDDGSSDDTLAIVEHWKRRWEKGTIKVVNGPQAGFLENFRSLIAAGTAPARFVGFCDQDDIWDHDKVSVAVGHLSGVEDARPTLYCSRTRLIDEAGNAYGNSPLFARPPSFRNALVQSLAGGNTMLMNGSAFTLLAESARRTTFVSHDWWAYMLTTGAGGMVIYDPQPHIAYRQHGTNLVGDNMGARARARRILRLLRGQLVSWNDVNFTALTACEDLLTEENRDLFRKAMAVHRHPSIGGWRRLERLGLYRQSRSASLALLAAAALGRF